MTLSLIYFRTAIQQLMVFGKLAASERDLVQKSLQLSIVINAVEIVESSGIAILYSPSR
jgi:hypothetical protein